jgi:two-component system sensor histidine kinase QseC
MRLFARYNRTNIITTIAIFITGSIALFFVLRYVLIKQLDEDLISEQQEIVQYVKKYNRLPPIVSTKEQLTTITPDGGTGYYEQFYSLTKWNPIQEEEERFREIKFIITLNHSNYAVTVSDSEDETYDLLNLIIMASIAMIALIMISGFLINRYTLNKLWRPFYRTIEKINHYHLNTQQPLSLEHTAIDEFDLLNENIADMVERIQNEYIRLKEFTGNAAHEMQTPLAVIRTKLDLLAQHDNLASRNVQPIQDIELAVHKLTRLFNSLLLLTKIENRQFELNEVVAFEQIIENKLSELAPLIEAKKIIVNKQLSRVHLMLHQQLADILIGNLLNNATRYTKEGGDISITLNHKELIVANASLLPALDEKRIFQRFYRHADTVQEGNGLGLSIVKQICDIAGYRLFYKYSAGQHIIEVLF